MGFWIRRNGASVAAPYIFSSYISTAGDGVSARLRFRSNGVTYEIPMVQSGKVASLYAYRPKAAFQLHAYRNGVVVHAVNGHAPSLVMNYSVTATRSSTGYGTTLKYRATFSKIKITISTVHPGMGAAIPISYAIGNKSGTVTFNAGVTSQSFEIPLSYTTAYAGSSNPSMSMKLSIAAGNYYASKQLDVSRTVYYSDSGLTITFYDSPHLSGMAGMIF